MNQCVCEQAIEIDWDADIKRKLFVKQREKKITNKEYLSIPYRLCLKQKKWKQLKEETKWNASSGEIYYHPRGEFDFRIVD